MYGGIAVDALYGGTAADVLASTGNLALLG
jgi:hypothetical protein